MNRHLRRLEKLEASTHTQSCTATDEEGKPFRLRRDDVLPLTVAAFRRRYAEIEGEPTPISRFDTRLDHLQRVGLVHTSEPLLGIACDVLRETQEAGNQ
jgi:hypothetical protein